MLGDSLRRRRSQRPAAPKRAKNPRRPRGRGWPSFSWLRWLGYAVLVLVASFGIGYLLSTLVLFPRPETAGAGIEVPRLYGLERTRAEETLREAGFAAGPVMELASLETEPGRVLAQDPIPGQQLRRGASVSYAISSGPPELRVPPVTGLTAGAARELLEAGGFEVEIEQIRTAAAPEGTVMRTDPEGGSPQRLPARVSLVIAVGLAADSLGQATDSLGQPIDSLAEPNDAAGDASRDSAPPARVDSTPASGEDPGGLRTGGPGG